MKNLGITGITRRKYHKATSTRHTRPYPDLVQRDFTAEDPNKIWVADITEIPTWEGLLYLAAVMDIWSRKIVGWHLASHMGTELVTTALKMAINQRKPAKVVHHSDQGSQYTSIAFGLLCWDNDVVPSMGSVGDCYDNAMAESFFATVECELLAQTTLKTHSQAKQELFTWIEGWYNTRRRHSGIGNQSPLNYEERNWPN
jgi:putative transposase